MSHIASTEVILPHSLSAEARGQLIDTLYALHQRIFDGVERALLTGEPRSASIRLATASTLVRLQRAQLLPLLEADARLRTLLHGRGPRA